MEGIALQLSSSGEGGGSYYQKAACHSSLLFQFFLILISDYSYFRMGQKLSIKELFSFFRKSFR